MDEPTFEYKIIVGIILCIISLLTAIGNSLVIISIILVKSLQTPSNFLIISLAVSDLLVSILVLPYSIYKQISIDWGLGEYICYTYNIFDVLLCTSSILNLCAISIDRYRAITKPLQYAKNRTMKHMLLMILIVWLLAFLISVPPIFITPPITDGGRCDLSENIWYQMYSTFGAFYLPLFVMIILYIRIFKLARKMAQKDSELIKIARRASNMHNEADTTLYSKPEHRSHVKLLYSNLKEDARNIPISAPISVRFPLPPSELCRRRCPRIIKSLENFTHSLNIKVERENDQNGAGDASKTSTTNFSYPTNAAINTNHFHNKSEFTIPYVDQSIETLINAESDRIARPVIKKPTEINENYDQKHDRLIVPSSELIDVTIKQFSLPVSPVHEAEREPDQQRLNISSSFNAKSDLVIQNRQKKTDSSTGQHLYKQKEKSSLATPQMSKFHKYQNTRQSLIIGEDDEPSNSLIASKSTTIVNNNISNNNNLNDGKYFLGRRQSSVITLNQNFEFINNKRSVDISSAQNLSHFSLSLLGKSAKKTFGSENTANHHHHVHHHHQKKSSSETKAIKTLGVIMGCFCLCWIPFFIIAISKPIYRVVMDDKRLPISMHAESFFLWLGYVNSTFNPIIYALFNLEFRVPFKHLLTCRCQNLNARLRSERYANEFGSLVFS